jgi:hypothetical protein
LWDWLSKSSVDSTRLFDVIFYTEKNSWQKITINKKMASLLESNTIVGREFLDEISSIVGWNHEKVYEVFVKQSQPTDENYQKGKFGEILHGEILTQFFNLMIPIKKYQYQFNPNTALHGTDLIAYSKSGQKIEAYYFVETKLRTTSGKKALIDAFQQTIKTRDEKTPSYFKFMLNQLFKEDRTLHKLFLEYGVEISPKDHFRIGMVYDDSVWNDSYLDELLTVYDRSISNLSIDLIKINSLNQLVQASYNGGPKIV